jgi:HSP20 family molecular chaperone IbpA
VPGVNVKDLEVRVAPRSVCIIGKRQALPQEKSVYSERRSNRIFRVWDLPYEIDPYRVAASVGGGILEVKLPKVASRYVAAGYAQAASA